MADAQKPASTGTGPAERENADEARFFKALHAAIDGDMETVETPSELVADAFVECLVGHNSTTAGRAGAG